MSVKVGVRVRPFNKRQQQLNCKCCIQMIDHTTHLHQLDTNDTKSFVFDYSFWSHDKFIIDADGIYQPIDDKYADQKRVYNLIGTDILVNAWQGYNCCLFAYGQTGSGKSYSMLGYGANKGIIPMVCDNIFDKIQKDNDKTHSYQVKVSMMQIYNQTLRDLLAIKNKKHTQLKICQSKKLGVYVQGLIKHPVHSYEQINKKIEQGSNNRSIAATLMNQSSSRSHTIVSITFIQKIQTSTVQTSIKYSTIHLVDLAGSESVGKTGVDNKDRLRQAAKINQSLSTLGRVIQILAQNASKNNIHDKIFVPYRDSKLTFILRNALGGNSQTCMICAISPADDNYQQTLSTLRYASRAKKIQNKAIINQSDVDKLIRMLRQENQMLKKMLKQAKFNKTIINMELISDAQQMNKNMADLGIIPHDQLLLDQDDHISNTSKDDIKQRDNYTTNNNNNFSNKDSFSNISLSQNSILDYDDKIDQKQPYITNISQDQLLSKRLKYSCSYNNILTIGNKYGIPRPNVVLAALGVLPLHCIIKNIDGKIYIEIQDQHASQYTFVNGQNVIKGQIMELINCDRLIFGTGCVFMVVIPGKQTEIRRNVKDNIYKDKEKGEKEKGEKDSQKGQKDSKKGDKQKNIKQLKPQDIDYSYALTQMQEKHVAIGLPLNDKNKIEQQQIRKKVLQQIQLQYDKMKILNQQQLKNRLKQQQNQFKQKITEIQKLRSQQAKKLKQQLQKQSLQANKLKIDKQKIQQQIIQFKQLQHKLQQSNIDNKQALQQARIILDQKIQKINQLQKSLLVIETKQIQMKQQMQKKQIIIQKQLQYKMIMCNNQNILNQYKLELSKKTKNTNQLKQLLIKKQRIEMQKQLIQLVPMVQKFNLIAKQMNKNIECGMSIDYNYISQGQVLQILKNNTYKNKLKINIHVYNKNQKRSYFWSVQVFKNRYQLAISMFQIFIRNPRDQQLFKKDIDPYWDPPCLQLLGDLSIVKKGDKIGKIHVKIYPTDNKKTNNLSLQTMSGITIYNPRDFIEKNIYFCIELSNLKLQKQYIYSGVQFQYTLIQNSYKNLNIQTPILQPSKFQYNNFHIISDMSQTVIVQYVDQPLALKLWGQIKQQQQQDDNLTNRDQSEYQQQSLKGSFVQTKSVVSNQQNNNNNGKVSPMKKQGSQSGIIVSNFQVMSKIDAEFIKKKQQIQKQQQLKKSSIDSSSNKKQDSKKGKGKGKDDCNIF